jgi:hypothetical protein
MCVEHGGNAFTEEYMKLRGFALTLIGMTMLVAAAQGQYQEIFYSTDTKGVFSYYMPPRLVFTGGNLYTVANGGFQDENYVTGGIGLLSPRQNQHDLWDGIIDYTWVPQDEGDQPVLGLTADASGNMFGVSSGDQKNCSALGAPYCGTIYAFSASGVYTTLYAFMNGADGAFPSSVPALDAQGNIYTTMTIGSNGNQYGSVFRLTNVNGVWQGATIYNFANDKYGSSPGMLFGKVAIAVSGNIYGTAQFSGNLNCNPPNGCGTIYRLRPTNDQYSIDLIHSFTALEQSEGRAATGLSISAGGLYGVAQQGNCSLKTGICGSGFVYTVTHKPSGQWVLATVYKFIGVQWNGNGSNGHYNPISDAAGNLYGTTSLGIYKMTLQPDGTYKNKVLYWHFLNRYHNPSWGPLLFGPTGVVFGSTANGDVNRLHAVFSCTNDRQIGR